ncbi:hypothetical protein JYK14_07365 [Siccirubricoccus sp. KC 17139]|uniref:KANL3/Tex30 alpha/beta hydrolase-like domain-containing protein n=1 Tax=Siccirubricoccus soli TaxID=2899147 RepID=A0ABT1D269_9PROT|nr:alpha/beta family hydrolase [Siccirubricoccus soli]MCO6415993.1 hypothetical protein [Siccirubricoccus soli]MCP2682125.1 hypothetical protein [Siccirubricoccus soli]
MKLAWGIYLAGASYPKDARIEAEVTRRIAPVFGRWTSQQSLLDEASGSRFEGNPGRRLAGLSRVVPYDAAARGLVLLGRSSGGRVATVFAGLRPVSAVICLGYPFRHPTGPREPERFAHLAHMTTPTLILQGRSDVYGGASLRQDYPLSDRVRLEFLDCGHEFQLDPQGWDRVGDRILSFLAALQR